MNEVNEEDSEEEFETEDFSELVRYTIPGYIAGLLAGVLLDNYGYQRSALGQWLVRTLSGEGESIFEGIYSIRHRLGNADGTMAEAYGWGKLFGIVIPWLIDIGSRLAGIDVYGIEGFYIPYFYALSDQIGANISGMLFLKKKEGLWSTTVNRYIHHPVMLSSLTIILVVPLGLLSARFLGFSPANQTFTALETIVANLCWIPPLVGWLIERKK